MTHGKDTTGKGYANMVVQLIKMDLHLFDGEGASAAPSTDGTSQSDTGATTVVYGRMSTAEAQSEETAENPAAGDNREKAKDTSEEDRKAQFDKFIKENKDLFVEKFNDTYNKRHKADRKAQEDLTRQLNAVSPIVHTLMEKYNVTDVEELANALDNDQNLWEQEAYEAGMSTEQYNEIRKLKAEKEHKEAIIRQYEAQRNTEMQYNAWIQEADVLKVKYPDFDLETELQNPEFRSLITTKNGDYAIPMEKAYELIHMNDILNNATIKAKDEVKKQVTDDIRARGARPSENGIRANNGVVYKSDVSKLTKRDRAEIVRKVAKGERISFD